MENKEDVSYCMISDVKCFNQHVEYQHFKMDSVWTPVRLLTPKDAYHSVTIAEPHTHKVPPIWMEQRVIEVHMFSRWFGCLLSYQANEADICHSAIAGPVVFGLYR